MYLDLASPPMTDARQSDPRSSDWTVLIPFFNERDYIAATIASLARQTVATTIVLIDNGSTDGSAIIALEACRDNHIAHALFTERTPGKIAALRAGLDAVRTPYVATCDADTIYPAHYLAEAQRVLERPGCAIAGAYFVAPDADDEDRLAKSRSFLAVARLLPRQCHTGGAGQAFRTSALRAAGGFDPRRWSFVLEDHEIIHRVMPFGTMRYSSDLWCVPSPRKRDRASIRWTLVERLTYLATAPWAGDWFFYSFLARRLARRRLLSHRMRERRFQMLEGPALATSHSMF